MVEITPGGLYSIVNSIVSYLTFSHYVSYSGPNSSHPNPGPQLLKLDSPKGFDEEVS